jgi:hypothetical protein
MAGVVVDVAMVNVDVDALLEADSVAGVVADFRACQADILAPNEKHPTASTTIQQPLLIIVAF